jgi:hypothetical protein
VLLTVLIITFEQEEHSSRLKRVTAKANDTRLEALTAFGIHTAKVSKRHGLEHKSIYEFDDLFRQNDHEQHLNEDDDIDDHYELNEEGSFRIPNLTEIGSFSNLNSSLDLKSKSQSNLMNLTGNFDTEKERRSIKSKLTVSFFHLRITSS